MAVTLFGAAGLMSFYRGVAADDHPAGAIAVVLLLCTLWSWSAFVDTSGAGERAVLLAGVGGAAVAIVLLIRGFLLARWLEVFSGLGVLAAALSAGFLQASVGSQPPNSAIALLSALAGMTSLYGLLVDIELAGHRSSEQWLEARLRLETATREMSDLLHDLRSGLLSIEAASGDPTMADTDPVRREAARLRRLTIGRTAGPKRFDLIPGLMHLVAAKRAANVDVIARIPTSAIVAGIEDELLSVVENLLSNAQRHGRAPIFIDLITEETEVRLSVSDSGDGVAASDADRVFRRGFTSHPEGSGIGLARSRMLAARNDAALVLDVRNGASFVLVMSPAAEVVAT